MNAAFYIIAIPAFITSFLYLSLGWGFRVSVPVTALEMAAAIGGLIYMRRRKSATRR
ncbi:MAG: hypothetical protein WAK91_04750 [Candidatus Acidiferrales bacterium]|jgi:hypothetical protein